jgi:RNA polymerase sigma-70 factor (ECF subfamily)
MAFPSTHWTLLAAATLHGSRVAAEALGDFYVRYRGPVRSFFLLRGVPPGEVDDVVQEFFLHAMERSLLRRAERERGRFRSWLCGAAVRFLSQRHHHGRALKRGAGVADLSLDEEGVEEQVTMDDQRDFDRDWAVRILELAFERVQSDYRDHPARFLVLREFLPGSAPSPRSAEAAALLGMNENTLRSEVHRLRRRFRECLRAEVVLTTTLPHEVDAEMAWLREVLSAQPAGETTPE